MEGQVKLRDGRKVRAGRARGGAGRGRPLTPLSPQWKTRWLVLRKPSPVAGERGGRARGAGTGAPPGPGRPSGQRSRNSRRPGAVTGERSAGSASSSRTLPRAGRGAGSPPCSPQVLGGNPVSRRAAAGRPRPRGANAETWATAPSPDERGPRELALRPGVLSGALDPTGGAWQALLPPSLSSCPGRAEAWPRAEAGVLLCLRKTAHLVWGAQSSQRRARGAGAGEGARSLKVGILSQGLQRGWEAGCRAAAAAQETGALEPAQAPGSVDAGVWACQGVFRDAGVAVTSRRGVGVPSLFSWSPSSAPSAEPARALGHLGAAVQGPAFAADTLPPRLGLRIPSGGRAPAWFTHHLRPGPCAWRPVLGHCREAGLGGQRGPGRQGMERPWPG